MRTARLLVVVLGLGAFLVPFVLADQSAPRHLTFEDRVRAQRAIEEVY